MIMTCCPMKYCILHDWLSYASIVYTNANIKISLLLFCSCMIQFPPEMDENWVRYGLAKLGQISRTKLAEDAVLCIHNTASALNR